MYVDDFITGQDIREKALFMSRHAKNIMKEAGMEMRKGISNDTALMAQWVAEGFDTYPMDASISLETNETKVLGIAWQTLDDCLSLDTKDHLRIPRLVLDPTNDEVSDLIEIHIFCDASKLAYGAADYVKVRKQKEGLVNLITSKTMVAPLKAVTVPRLELLGALVVARLSSRVQEIIHKKKECKVFHWTNYKTVLFWIKGSSKRWKQFVANRVQEISKLTDPDSWFHCSRQDDPSDFLTRKSKLGGLWETNIKSLKYHFKRVAGNSKFSYEELLTLITQIEANLNSRPLTTLSSNVDDSEVLTPANFLIRRPIRAIVEPSLLQCESNRLNVWQRITQSVQTIWKRWSLSYLNSLQQRKKWIVDKENLKLGDMVLIRE
ncbi:uncharacterized protein TNCV_988931 [Trichonephila clavipes]|nr:uncharacterized protein TNCV_988931 [Trichonephila clavipes]